MFLGIFLFITFELTPVTGHYPKVNRTVFPVSKFKGLEYKRVRCPQGWKTAKTQCFQYQSELKTFREAVEECPKKNPNAKLARIWHWWGNRIMMNVSQSPAYIGLNVGPTLKETRWINSSADVLYYNELKYYKEGCGGVMPDGVWVTLDCETKRTFWCSIDKLQCPPKFINVAHTCYALTSRSYYEGIASYIFDTCHSSVYKGSELAHTVDYHIPYVIKVFEEAGIAKAGYYTYTRQNSFKKMRVRHDLFNYLDGKKSSNDGYGYILANSEVVKNFTTHTTTIARNYLCEYKLKPVHSSCGNANSNWVEDIDSGDCYFISETPKNWTEAEKTCMESKEPGVHLTSITDSRMQLFIETIWDGDTLRDEFPTPWIGLSRDDQNTNWMDGSPFIFDHFNHEHVGKKGCASINLYHPYGKWEFGDCEEEKPFICQKRAHPYKATKETFSKSTEEGLLSAFFDNCPSGWIRLKELCYIFPEEKHTFYWAQVHCKSLHENAVIASVADEEVHSFITGQVKMETFVIGNLTSYPDYCEVILPTGGVFSYSCNAKTKFVCSNWRNKCEGEVFDGTCFHLSTEAKNCSEAMRDCYNRSPRGYLSSIHSVFANEYLSTLAKGSSFLIGLSGTHSWHDGSAFDFNNLQQFSTTQCKVLEYGGNWMEVNDSSKFKYFCSYKSDMVPTCNPGWKAVGKSCILFHNVKLDWWSAMDSCERFGGQIPQVISPSLQEYIQSNYKDIFEDNTQLFWVGLKSSKLTTNAFFLRRSERSGSINWMQNEPSIPPHGSKKENCVANDIFYFEFKIELCTKELVSICERPRFIEILPENTHCARRQSHFGELCYEVFIEKYTYAQAVENCKIMDGQLLTIKNEFTQHHIEFLLHGINQPVWLGLEEHGGKLLWNGVPEDPFSEFSNWVGVPPSGKDMCALTLADGNWTSIHCRDRQSSICQYAAHEPINTEFTDLLSHDEPREEELFCPYPYLMAGQYCYRLVNWHDANFFEAKEICSRYGEYLASFQKYIHERSIMQSYMSSREIFLGLRENPALREYEWDDPDVQYGLYTNWAPHQHNSSHGHCVCSYQWRWRNCDCKRTAPFICMRKGVPNSLYAIVRLILVFLVIVISTCVALYYFFRLLRYLGWI